MRHERPHGELWTRRAAEPHEPWDFAHHTVLRDCDARLFDTLVRHLRLRLFDGRLVCRRDLRAAALRQGPAPRTALAALGAGLVGLVLCAMSAAPGPPPTAKLAVASAAFLGVGAFLGAAPRKYISIVSHPAEGGRVDLWIAGTGTRAAFAVEFAGFLADARELARATDIAASPVEPATPPTATAPPAEALAPSA